MYPITLTWIMFWVVATNCLQAVRQEFYVRFLVIELDDSRSHCHLQKVLIKLKLSEHLWIAYRSQKMFDNSDF